jgi:CelD/BcsL family acetyltransferase involved in cellulose biosynthesis
MELWAGDHHIGGQYAFAWADRWFWELPARAVGFEWQRFSLGPTLLMLLLRRAIDEGRIMVEGGLGHYEYKLRLGAEEHVVRKAHLLAPGRTSAMKRLMARSVQAFLRMSYHKIWYRRVQPRLPRWLKRPQWSVWLAYDY